MDSLRDQIRLVAWCREDWLLVGGKDVIGLLHQCDSDGLLQEITAQIIAEDIAKLARFNTLVSTILTAWIQARLLVCGSSNNKNMQIGCFFGCLFPSFYQCVCRENQQIA